MNEYRFNVQQLSNVWYDRREVDINASECRESVIEAHNIVKALIEYEMKLGIQPEQIVIGNELLFISNILLRTIH